MNPEDYEAGNQIDADIKKLADDGVALLLSAAKLAGDRGMSQAQAFNRFVTFQLGAVQAATLKF